MESNNQLSEIEREELEYLRLFASYVSVKNIELAIDFVDDYENIRALKDEFDVKVDGINFIRWLKSRLIGSRSCANSAHCLYCPKFFDY